MLTFVSMFLVHDLDNESAVSKYLLYCTVYDSMTRQSAQCWVTAGQEKLKRFNEDDLKDFTAVDKEARSCTYTEADIHAMRAWMVDNKATLDSPNEKDTIRARDIYGS